MFKIKEIARVALQAVGGKNFLLYLLFVVVAFAFWVMLSLDAEVQHDYEVPVRLVGVPDSVTIIDDTPRIINVNVKGKGSQLLRFSWGGLPSLNLDFRAYYTNDGRVAIPKARLDARLRDYFGSGVGVMSAKPDSIVVRYTSRPGVYLPLKIVADVHPDLQCIVNGDIRADVDSVQVFSIGDLPRSLTEIETMPIVKSGLKDTTVVEVKLRPVAGMRIKPSAVKVTIPVEPLISKHRSADIEVINLPADMRVLTFPSKVDVSYLVPMSRFNDDYPLRGYVDYNDIRPGISHLPVTLNTLPPFYINATVAPESVEFMMEKLSE